jgi:hypothetical protein
MSPAAFLVVAAPAAAIFAAPRAPLGGRHTRCSIGLQADEAIADSRRAFLAQQRPTSGTEAFANTQWSLLLKMKGGGGTMFSVELREDMCCRFSDNDETGEQRFIPWPNAACHLTTSHDELSSFARSQVAGRRRRSGSLSRNRKASQRAAQRTSSAAEARHACDSQTARARLPSFLLSC